MSTEKPEKGVVYLVGAGPGDPDLITVRAKYVLDHCDVVVYDSLIPYELLYVLPAEVERRYVGKEAGRHSLPQDEINGLLVKLAREGKRVVRLKGGDPFVFGRGGEEASHLEENGVRYEVVPGITSGVAALAYAGIPCTDRRKASYVMFLTGHESVDEVSSQVPWDWVAGSRNGTLVIYMGVAEIKNVVKKLLAAGMRPDMPATAIERGTISTQRVVTTTLTLLPDKVVELGLKPPALFVLGEVTGYRDKIQWLESRPLFGIRVMITRQADRAAPLYRRLRELGAEVQACPTIVATEDYRSDHWEALRGLAARDRWLVFTEENSVRYFVKQWLVEVGDVRGLKDYKIAAAGGGTIRALNDYLITPDFVSSAGETTVLADEMKEKLTLSGTAVVRVRENLEDDDVEKVLERAGADVVALQVHRVSYVEWPAEAREKLFAFPPDVILLTSVAELSGLMENLEEGELKEIAAGATVVTAGPSTSEHIRSHGLTVDLELDGYTVPIVADGLLARHRVTPLTRSK